MWRPVLLLISFVRLQATQEVHVHPVLGHDGNLGDSHYPFRSLIRAARAVVESFVPLTVHLHDGVYHLDGTLTLDERHANSVWKAQHPERVHIQGGHSLSNHEIKKLSGGIYALPLDIDVPDITSDGSLSGCGTHSIVTWNDERMQLARSRGWSRIVQVKGSNSIVFANLTLAPGMWLHGYWQYDWADSFVRVLRVRGNQAWVNESQISYHLTKNARFYALDALSLLDEPGEYYIDRSNRVLYLYPPEECSSLKELQIWLNTGDSSVQVENTVNVTMTGIHWKGVRIKASNVSDLHISQGSISHATSQFAVELRDVVNSTIRNMNLSDLSCGGLYVEGGDRRTLLRSGNEVTGNNVERYSLWKRSYTSGIIFAGCGHEIANNFLASAPHQGMTGHGNEMRIYSNTFEDLCTETSDASAFYAGRSWADRGNVVTNNTFRRIRRRTSPGETILGFSSVQAIYLDDQMSGYIIMNNIVEDSDTGILLGGGRDNRIVSNRFINTDLPISFDSRGLSWDAARCQTGGEFQIELDKFGYNHMPWVERYPSLKRTFQDSPCTPVHNVIEDFRYCGLLNASTWIETNGTSVERLVSYDNTFMHIRVDPHMCDSFWSQTERS